MDHLPSSVRLACWLGAWLDGRVPTDDTIDALSAVTPEIRWDDESLTPALALGRVRSAGTRGCVALLPAPGDAAGLTGPPATNAAVIDGGEGVALVGANLALVPQGDGWVALTAHAPAPGHWREQGRALRRTLLETTDELSRLDVASWNPDLADGLLNVHSPRDAADVPVPTPEVAGLMEQAARCLAIVHLARTDDGGAVSAFEARQRLSSLTALDRAARLALSAATAAPLDRG